jgi:Domain of unknown function (DUF4082)/Bacterial Ig-like domain
VSGAQDAAGNPIASPYSWSFTTTAYITGTVFGNTTPTNPAQNDSNSVELGVKFDSSVAGYITGIRFYKGSGNTGTHVGHLWTSTGTLLASATFTGESSSGWQQVNFSTPVAIAANTTYVASYLAPHGHYADIGNYFATTGVTNGPLTALSNSAAGGNGVYLYGPSGGFPTNTYKSTNYYVDVVFTNEAAPTVTGSTPAKGPTGVLPNITATFNEPVQSGTISFTLDGPGNTPISGSVGYNSFTNTATFAPNAALAVSTTYTATVSGAQDAVGNAMTSPDSWSFTTAAYVTGTIFGNLTPTNPLSGDLNAIELGVKFDSSVAGYITGIRFYKGSGNTGTHVGYLWTSTGTLLASATFSGETASGWQQVNFSTPVAIAANTTYVASYLAPNGDYADDGSYFASAGVTNYPLTALSNSAAGGNGVYLYGPSGGFPTNTSNSTNYWVDVVFTNQPFPPTVTGVTPANGATGVSTKTPNITAKFNEPVQSGTISFTLVGPGNTPVSGSVGYNAATNTATFTPHAPLSVSTTYTATVSGAQDAAGNPMTSPASWSFTTGSIAQVVRKELAPGLGTTITGSDSAAIGTTNEDSGTEALDAVLAGWTASGSSMKRK